MSKAFLEQNCLSRETLLSWLRELFAVVVVFAPLILFTSQAALADALQDAAAAFKKEDYSTALHLWLPLAEQGNAEAERGMGILYGNGLAVPEDDVQAAAWFRKAADQGDSEAEFSLGERYVQGNGVSLDIAQGLALVTKAANQGNVRLQTRLGDLYGLGSFGIPKDATQAFLWYRKAADLGDPLAEGKVANAYEFGSGVPQDRTQAEAWRQRAEDHYRKEAEQGDADAEWVLGFRFEMGVIGAHGIIARPDREKALYWYRKAAQQDGPYKPVAIDSVARVEKEIKSATGQ